MTYYHVHNKNTMQYLNMALNVCTFPHTKSSLSQQGRGGLSIYACCTAILL